jgi:Protein of unknown function (DUF3631)
MAMLSHPSSTGQVPLAPVQVGRVGRVSEGIVGDIEAFLSDYVALPPMAATVIAAWVLAAWLSAIWDRFPHLAITSPEKRCGKTRLLEILQLIVPGGRMVVSMSAAAIFRSIRPDNPMTLLYDEAQSLSRDGKEDVRDIFCAGITKSSTISRCIREDKEWVPKDFGIYCPKILAAIEPLNAILADRCLPVRLQRNNREVQLERYLSRNVEARGIELRCKIERWAKDYAEFVAQIYSNIVQPFGIDNERMAELLLPLQAVTLSAGGRYDVLESYAISLDERDRQEEAQSYGVRLLAAIREEFNGMPFIPTKDLIAALVAREEEPWFRWNRGDGMNPEALSRLLRPYRISPQHSRDKKSRGYYAADFQDAWTRYLPPL